MGVSSPKRSVPDDTADLKQTEDVHKTGTNTPTAAGPSIPVEKASKMVQKGQEQGTLNLETKTQVLASAAASETDTTLLEPDQEQEAAMHTPEKDEELSVISSDVSPHDSDFDFLQINTDTSFSLLTPSPCRRRSLSGSSELEMGPLASPPLSGASSIACSPSRFFKSPLVTSAASRSSERRAVRTPQRRTIVPMRLTTPTRMLDIIGEQEEKQMTPIQEETEGKPEAQQQQVTCARPPRQASTSATPPRTPARQQLLSRRLQDVFDRSYDNEGREALKSPSVSGKEASTLLDADDIHCVPSGLMTSPSEHDSFFSFANSLSPLMPAEEFGHSFMAVKLSPLVSLSSYDLPRLLPPFPEQDHDDGSPTGLDYNTPTILKTPQNKKRGVSPAGSLAGGCISTPGSASAVVSPSLFSDSFPNIQASTSATPGKDERSKLGGHSVMKMKLHTSFGAFDSHTTREMQAINNSLKRKKYVRRRKAEERQQMKPSSSSSNVQRKLLQTPVETSASPRTRSPLHPWNGQTSPATMFKTPTPRKLAPAQRLNLGDAPSYAPPPSPPVARKLIPASEPTAETYTPVINQKKRKATQCVSIPSSMANLSSIKMRKSPLGARQAVGVAVTPAKQIKREVNATPPGKYTLLTPQNNRGAVGMPPFDASMFKTPSPIGTTTSLKMSLQSASIAPLVPGVMPAQVSKKAPCNCKKSKCLKLYCECFASGGYCDESCNCQDCANTTAKEDVRQQAIAARLEKNPNAFKPKIGATAAMVTLTPGSARRLSASGGSHSSTGSFVSSQGQLSNQQQHLLGAKLVTTKMHKHGCHCKKSACQKKYCECFQAGVPCGENCRCIDCKNQAPCVAHANGMTTPGSAVGATPARIANELDETFVSPVLRTVRQHLRIDRETWTKNFASPFETSPGREQQRTELLRTRLVASTSAVDTLATPLGVRVRVRAAPFTSPPTPQMVSRIGVKRPRDMSPTRGVSDEQRAIAPSTGSLLKQYAFVDKAKTTVGRAVLSAVASSSAGAERVFVLPLFGAKLPPLESGVNATICRFLTNADLHNASLVSHLWNQVALGDTVWDHANFIPTEANVAASQHLQTKKLLSTSDTRNTDRQMVAPKREPDLSVLSALR